MLNETKLNISKSNTNVCDAFTRPEVIPIQFCLTLIGSVGLLENIGVILVMLRNTVMFDKPYNCFLASLALADAITCFGSVILGFHFTTQGVVSSFGIHVLVPFAVLSSVGNLSLLTFHRFLSIYISLRYDAYMTSGCAKRVLLIPWIVAFSLSALNVHPIAAKMINASYVNTTYYAVLILFITVLNSYILKQARDKRKDIKRLKKIVLTKTNSKLVLYKRFRLVNRQLLVSLIFFGSCVPTLITFYWYPTTESRSVPAFQRRFILCAFTIVLNVAINPLVYSKQHSIVKKFVFRTQNRLLQRNVVKPRALDLNKYNGAFDVPTK